MSKEFVQNKYNSGDVVYAKVNPTLKLVIRRYYDQVYYCLTQGHPERKDLVYFEREFVRNPELEKKNEEARSQN